MQGQLDDPARLSRVGPLSVARVSETSVPRKNSDERGVGLALTLGRWWSVAASAIRFFPRVTHTLPVSRRASSPWLGQQAARMKVKYLTEVNFLP